MLTLLEMRARKVTEDKSRREVGWEPEESSAQRGRRPGMPHVGEKRKSQEWKQGKKRWQPEQEEGKVPHPGHKQGWC